MHTSPFGKNFQKRKLLLSIKWKAFSLIEVMIALFVLSTGFMAMAGLMLQMTAQQGKSETMINLRELANAKLGQIAHVEFPLLATGSTTQEQELWGAPSQTIVTIASINKAGKVSNGANYGPFKYTMNFVVCKDDAQGGADAAGAAGDPCGDVAASRPDELACNIAETEDGQAMVKVLVTSRDKHGRCQKYSISKVLVDLSS